MKASNFFMTLLFILFIDSISAQDNWLQKSNFSLVKSYAVAFSISSKGYISTGRDSTYLGDDLWEYDPSTDSWTQKADFGGEAREYAVGFAIGNYGYVGTGESGGSLQDFWQYDPVSNTWSQKKKFPGHARYWAMGFSVGDKGYLGTGYDNGNVKKDFYEYDPAANTWTEKADVGSGRISAAVGFSIGDKGYMAGGQLNDGTVTGDLWEYDPASDQWTKKASCPVPRASAAAFSLNGKGYIGTGYIGTGLGLDSVLNDLWEYDPLTDTWTEKATFPGMARYSAVGFAIEGKGYIGTGAINSYTFLKDFWQYTPASNCAVPIGLTTTSITNSKATLNWSVVSGATKYQVRYKAIGNSTWTQTNAMGTSKTIMGLTANTAYTWQVRSVCSTNPLVASDWSAKQHFSTSLRLGLDETSNVLDVYPNPFSAAATISFSLAAGSHTVIELYDLSGKKISTVLDQNLDAGDQSVELNRNQLADGIYLLQLKTDNQISTMKIMMQ